MRCEKCSQLRPLFKKPSYIPINQVIEDLELFFEAIDVCVRVTVGGEAFLHPDIFSILSWLKNEKKAISVLLITNGIALPAKECIEILKDSKFYILPTFDHNGILTAGKYQVTSIILNNIKE